MTLRSFWHRIQPQHSKLIANSSALKTLDTKTRNSPHESKHATEYKHVRWADGAPLCWNMWIHLYCMIYFTKCRLKLHIPLRSANSKTHREEERWRKKLFTHPGIMLAYNRTFWYIAFYLAFKYHLFKINLISCIHCKTRILATVLFFDIYFFRLCFSLFQALCIHNWWIWLGKMKRRILSSWLPRLVCSWPWAAPAGRWEWRCWSILETTHTNAALNLSV